MKTPRIVEAIGNVDDGLLTGAAVKKRNPLRRLGAIAACLAVLLLAGAAILPLMGGAPSGVWVGGLIRPYGSTVIPAEVHRLWRWEDKTVFEQYTVATYNGKEYISRARAVDASLLGESLGTCMAAGRDDYTDQTYRAPFEARAIRGVSTDHLIALGLNGTYYVFMRREAEIPTTLGAFFQRYSPDQSVSLSRFSLHEDGRVEDYFQMESDAPLWQILADCSDAPLVYGSWSEHRARYVSFTVTSEALGVYKKVLYVSEDGYLQTNMMEVAYLYYIGEEAAAAILDYALSHSTPATFEPYVSTLAGTLTEIGDGYVLIDDSILCKHPSDGMVFKVYVNDPRLRRCLTYGTVSLGDTVIIEFTGTVSPADNGIDSAYSIEQATVIDGNASVPE
ncbi:MAG: hypothetical protein J6D21_06590 [Clostridia bacterium]|nr:hypothetical protein [Clostridia bacterium]